MIAYEINTKDDKVSVRLETNLTNAFVRTPESYFVEFVIADAEALKFAQDLIEYVNDKPINNGFGRLAFAP